MKTNADSFFAELLFVKRGRGRPAGAWQSSADLIAPGTPHNRRTEARSAGLSFPKHPRPHGSRTDGFGVRP